MYKLLTATLIALYIYPAGASIPTKNLSPSSSTSTLAEKAEELIIYREKAAQAWSKGDKCDAVDWTKRANTLERAGLSRIRAFEAAVGKKPNDAEHFAKAVTQRSARISLRVMVHAAKC